jgi:hypothetical protein
MIVPDAANMPPTPWQTEILAPGIWAGAMPRIWRTLSCNAYMPYMPECMYETAAISVKRDPRAAGAAGPDRGVGNVGAYTSSNFARRRFLGQLSESFFHSLQWKDESKGICWKRQKSEFFIETACPVIDGVNENCPRSDRL